MVAKGNTTVHDALMVMLGVGLVYGAIYFILSADARITWALVWQLPPGVIAVFAGLLIYGEAVWRSAKRGRTTTSKADNSK